MGDLLLDLGLELVGSALEFVEVFADLAGNLRQLLGPKDNEGQKEQEDCLGETHPVHHTVAEEGRAIVETKIWRSVLNGQWSTIRVGRKAPD